jgi:hypothetical protein
MTDRYSKGDEVLVSRDGSGEGHERGRVVDSYELIVNGVSRPTIAVEFEGGDREYVTAEPPYVLPVPDDPQPEGPLDRS